MSPAAQSPSPGTMPPSGLLTHGSVLDSSPAVASTEVLTDVRAFEWLSDEWDTLLDESAQQGFFLRWKWNHLWWQHYAPPGSGLHLIVCRDPQRRLIGLAPLYQRTRRVLGMTYFRELIFLGMGIDLKTSEHLDIIARHGAERAVAEAIVRCLRRNRKWDRLWLWQVPINSMMLPHLERAFGPESRTKLCDSAPYIDTSTNWATFKASFGRSMRRNVEYYPRRLFKRYPSLEFARVRYAHDLEPAMDALVRLHQARWESQGEPGAFRHGFDGFLREAMRDAFENSRLALWTLKIDGTIEAALVGFLDNGVLHYFQKGFNPAHRDDDLGTAMLALCVRDCFEDPEIRVFDFMGGGAAYKSLWARVSRSNVVLELQRPTLGNALYSLRTYCRDLLSSTYRRFVPKSIRVVRRERLRKRRLNATAHLASLLPLVTDWLQICEIIGL
jgi:hypothetical protein